MKHNKNTSFGVTLHPTPLQGSWENYPVQNEFAIKFVNDFYQLASLGFEAETKLRASGIRCLRLITYISRSLRKGGTGLPEPRPGGERRPLAFPVPSTFCRDPHSAWVTASPPRTLLPPAFAAFSSCSCHLCYYSLFFWWGWMKRVRHMMSF